MEYDPESGSLEYIKDIECDLHFGKLKLPANTINIEEEGIATDANGHPRVIYLGMEVDDEGVERILFTGHFVMSVSPPIWNIYWTRPRPS